MENEEKKITKKTTSNNRKKINFSNNIEKEVFDINANNSSINIINIWKKKPFSIFMMFISSFLFSFGVSIFLSQGRTIPSGLTAIPTLITYLFHVTEPYFALMYIGLNIPLIILFRKYLKNSFIYLTIIWMIFQTLWGLILGLQPINSFLKDNVSIWKKWNVNDSLKQTKDLWPILYYTIMGASLMGIGIGIAWKFGGSTGGTDIISYYFSTKKKKPIGKFMMIISIIISFASLTIFGLLGHFDITEQGSINELLGIQVMATILYILLSASIVNKIYPKYKKVNITIYTSIPQEVMQHLSDIKYWHSYNMWSGISGYTKQAIHKIETIALYLEVKAIIKEIKKIDPNIWVSIKPIDNTLGKFDTSKID